MCNVESNYSNLTELFERASAGVEVLFMQGCYGAADIAFFFMRGCSCTEDVYFTYIKHPPACKQATHVWPFCGNLLPMLVLLLLSAECDLS